MWNMIPQGDNPGESISTLYILSKLLYIVHHLETYTPTKYITIVAVHVQMDGSLSRKNKIDAHCSSPLLYSYIKASCWENRVIYDI